LVRSGQTANRALQLIEVFVVVGGDQSEPVGERHPSQRDAYAAAAPLLRRQPLEENERLFPTPMERVQRG
jgi:hypothetical protein